MMTDDTHGQTDIFFLSALQTPKPFFVFVKMRRAAESNKLISTKKKYL